ncbi:hypothetical protein DDQ41_22885 [Streptomyces spongiicola]|uniref:Uncharacterized protein n=1 Tax=Streptomyces spongiicola TaxID=1690221 RepID=A0ABN5KRZ3_9ACTN|nr:hypothetical protein DDQ41_22885 [Streptomyces spongiicola]
MPGAGCRVPDAGCAGCRVRGGRGGPRVTAAALSRTRRATAVPPPRPPFPPPSVAPRAADVFRRGPGVVEFRAFPGAVRQPGAVGSGTAAVIRRPQGPTAHRPATCVGRDSPEPAHRGRGSGGPATRAGATLHLHHPQRHGDRIGYARGRDPPPPPSATAR